MTNVVVDRLATPQYVARSEPLGCQLRSTERRFARRQRPRRPASFGRKFCAHPTADQSASWCVHCDPSHQRHLACANGSGNHPGIGPNIGPGGFATPSTGLERSMIKTRYDSTQRFTGCRSGPSGFVPSRDVVTTGCELPNSSSSARVLPSLSPRNVHSALYSAGLETIFRCLNFGLDHVSRRSLFRLSHA